jgi:hypothetical protein
MSDVPRIEQLDVKKVVVDAILKSTTKQVSEKVRTQAGGAIALEVDAKLRPIASAVVDALKPKG